ncbi:MAG: UDP-glucose 4-epimerase GalE [Proteobacteria bacterium]|nr:UDP-glucose 4-epimerase GalE [Pseudomonadota bacterium]
MRTVFVTGGAGYVGSHSCKAFAEAGWRVVVYDNLSRGYRDLVNWGELIEGDLNDGETLKAALSKTEPQVVAHYAAFASVPESMREPDVYYRINVEGTRSLLAAMRETAVKQLVFSSSCATYGVHDDLITEGTQQSPINPYGATKMVGERMIQDFDAAYGTRSVILRYFNAAGADAALATGERNTHDPRVIPLAIRGAMDGGFTFTIFGDKLGTRDGTCVRDYVHVTDLADAHLRALDWLDAGKESQVFNLGAGTGTSVAELADAVERISGGKITRKIAPPRAGDPPSLVASAAKAERLLGWKPQHSSIDNIIRTAWAWAQKDRVR